MARIVRGMGGGIGGGYLWNCCCKRLDTCWIVERVHRRSCFKTVHFDAITFIRIRFLPQARLHQPLRITEFENSKIPARCLSQLATKIIAEVKKTIGSQEKATMAWPNKKVSLCSCHSHHKYQPPVRFAHSSAQRFTELLAWSKNIFDSRENQFRWDLCVTQSPLESAANGWFVFLWNACNLYNSVKP